MSNKHYDIQEEIEITLKVKVKINKCSDYNHLNELQLADNVADFKSQIGEHLRNKLVDEYQREEVTMGVDDWSFDVE